MDKEKVKEMLNNPEKLDAQLKEFFNQMDKEKKGFVSFDTVHNSLHAALEKLGKTIHEEEHKPGELDAAKKICDPNGTGKVNYEGFKALVVASMKHQAEH